MKTSSVNIIFFVALVCVFVLVGFVSGHCEAYDKIWKEKEGLKKCCPSIADYDLDELNKEVYRKCAEDFDDDCEIIKCAFENLKFLNGRVVDADALIKHLTKNKNNSEQWKPSITSAVTKCKENMVGKPHPLDFFGDCLHILTFLGCPKNGSLITVPPTDPSVCADKRSILANCLEFELTGF